MDFKEYPYLSSEEFTETCHQFERLYCQAPLGSMRKRWKLRLCTALDISFSSNAEYTVYIQIIRPLEAKMDPDDLSSHMNGFSFGDRPSGEDWEEDLEMAKAEDTDEAALRVQDPEPEIGRVVYEIHLHPTYRVPCLWFSVQGLPPDEPVFNIDTIFRHLVPDQYKDGLRRLGNIGGISGDYHPVTGIPCFFVHPCLVGDQMAEFECTKENYLMIWLGLMGGCVGLWVPKEMAAA